MGLLIDGEEVLTDEYGYLIHFSDWHENVATVIAREESLTLAEDHWYVIYFMRNFYQQYHTTPRIRLLAKQLMTKVGSKSVNSLYLNSLFPKGVLKQASKLAGLPRPARCM